MAPSTLRIKNKGTVPFMDKYKGEQFIIPPGEATTVPAGAAHLWLGRPDEDEKTAKKRTRLRKGKFYGILENLEVEEVNEEDIIRQLKELQADMDKRSMTEAEADEKPFPELQEEEDDIEFLDD